ncbi:Alpha/Beta hydrolase protein [Mycena filopes]|nr:Alpha/Beta hydrolase protein [Mycena filopes]
MISTSFSQRILLAATLCVSGALAQSDFDWQTLHANTTLHWTPCYSAPLQCARLQVPMDYSAPHNGVTASIAIVRFPATAPKSQYRGPLLFNPGGPGGSGVDAIVGAGAEFATVFGEQFDIVGFDPRGVSYSTPTISFFKTEAQRRFLVPSPNNVLYASFNASSSSLADSYANMHLLGKLAVDNDPNQYLQHMSTDNIARDMLTITEAFGFQKLQYWGISYGSVLGATFATLFPDKVGRLIIDGVEDMNSYYTANFTNGMLDTDKSMQMFYDACFKAGPDACAFYAPSAAQIASSLAALTASVKANPIAVLTPESHGILDYVFLRNAVLDALFAPYDAFAALAQGLAALQSGNATLLYAQNEVPTFECDCSTPAPAFHLNNFEAYMTIACGDALYVNDTIPQLQQFYENGLKVSTSFADLLLTTRVLCAGYKTHREGRFTGPIGAKKTSFPLLLIGNTLDPVTAHANAVKTSLTFPGSAVLTQDCIGHTSLVASSDCTFGYMRAYFVNGTLPPPGTVCAVEAELFPFPSNGTATKRSLESAEVLKMREAGERIGSVVRAIMRRSL